MQRLGSLFRIPAVLGSMALLFVIIDIEDMHGCKRWYMEPPSSENDRWHSQRANSCRKCSQGKCVTDERGASNKSGREACLTAKLMPEQSMPYIVLVSFPGSGNTWLRYLIERATGIYTGSKGNDKTLHDGGFFGQLLPARSGQTIVVKAHQVDINEDLDGIVLLIRNPYDAMISEFNRKYTKGNHTGLVTPKQLKSKDWTKFAEEKTPTWRTLIENCLKSKTKKLHVIYYEDLKKRLEEELKRLAAFLDLSLNEERLNCTLQIREGNFHRPQRPLTFDPFTKPMRLRLNRDIGVVMKLFERHNLPGRVMKQYKRK